MKTIPRSVLGLIIVGAATAAWGAPTPVSWLEMDTWVRQGWDSNVYWMDCGPLAHRASPFTVLGLTAGLRIPLSPEARLVPSFGIEQTWFTEEPGETHARLTARLQTQGRSGDWSWDADLQQARVDGDRDSLVWTQPGGAPADGGYEIRNRRDQATLDHRAQLTWKPGPLWGRAVYRGILHDFQTAERDIPGYQNYVDRSDWQGGLDAGWTAVPGLGLSLGGRAGLQEQSTVLDSPVEYSNTYHRLLAGIQAGPWKGWMLDAEIGPDFRHFGGTLPAGEPRDRTEVAYRAALEWEPTSEDRWILRAQQFLFPSSSGRGMLRDGMWSVEWQHTWPGKVATITRFKVHENDFFPHARRDRLYTPSLEVKWPLPDGWTTSCGYEYTWSESEVPAMPAREFTRHRIQASVAWTF